MGKKTWGVIIALIFIVFIIASLLCLNCLPEQHWGKYFFVKFGDLLNILVLGIVIYIFVEYKNDSRSKKIFLEHLINRIIIHLEDERLYRINQRKDVNYIRVTQKLIYNELSLLSDYSDEFTIQNEILYCNTTLKNYWDKVSDRIESVDKLKEIEIELHNEIVNLIWKLEYITVKLYK